MEQTPDRKRVQEFARKLFGHYTSGMLTMMVDIGHKTGLFEALATAPDTSQRIADRAGLDERYVREWLGAKGLPERLAAGIRVADLGCGTGHAINLMAREYPASTFIGYDIASDAIEHGRAEARSMGLSNARFEKVDVARLPAQPNFDLITS